MSSTSARRQLARGIITHDDDGNRLVSLAGGHGPIWSATCPAPTRW